MNHAVRWWALGGYFRGWARYAGSPGKTARMGLCNPHECGCVILCNTVHPRRCPDYTPELVDLIRATRRAKGGPR